MSLDERLPVVEGVRSSDPAALVASVFEHSGFADPNLIGYYRQKLASRAWRSRLIKTVRGTMEHRVADKFESIRQPTLLVVGKKDRIVNPVEALQSGRKLPNGELVEFDACGNAPQIELAHRVNPMVVEFLTRTAA